MSEVPGSIGLVVAALYRRYRPDSFAEMIGQSQVTEPLMTALRTGRVGHAYLFSGPRGCGKTTSARILARCLNCAEGPTDTPCGTCPSCVELSRDGGGSLDVVEIDAASHGGVDDARDLRERAVFAPARDRYKIFIIDEAHMVTPGGFNALLKIVEEPPPHVKFIFATTEPDKVIGTIRSRTHHYPFRLIAPATLIDYIQTLCDSEGVQVEPGVLPLVVRAGGGSARDTLSILDQLIAGSEGNLVTANRAAGLLGFTHTELLDDVVVAFGAHDAAAAFQATDRVVQTGQDPRRFVEDLLERLRDLIVVTATTVEGAAAVFRGVPQDQLTRMFEQAQAFGPGELSRIADTVSATLDKMAGATAPRLQLELMIARALVVHGESAQRSAGGLPQRAGAQAQGGSVQSGSVQSGPAQGSAPASMPQTGAAPQATQPPTQPQKPSHDPVAALAAARGAVTAPAAPATLPPGEPPQASTAPQAAAPAEPSAEAAAPNAAQTAASIRDFLSEEDAADGIAKGQQSASTAPQDTPAAPHPNEGAASFGRPISDVLSTSQIESIGTEQPASSAVAPTPTTGPQAAQLTGPQPTQTTEPQSPVSPAEPTQASAASTAENTPVPTAEGAEEFGLEDLLEVWTDLLEEILERDREAWNAVRSVAPLALEGDVLTVGLASQSDLAAFKSIGAGPLREAILSAVGVNVKYVPKRLPEGHVAAGQNAPRESQTGSAADAEEPHRAGSASPSSQPSVDNQIDPADPEQRAAARLSALGPALAAPAWADPQPEPVPSIGEFLEAAPAAETTAEAPQQTAAPEDAGEKLAEQPVSDQSRPEQPGPEQPVPEQPNSDADDSYVEPSDDPYGDDDPYAGGDPYAEGSGDSAVESLPAEAPALADAVAGADAADPEPANDAPPVSVSVPASAPATEPRPAADPEPDLAASQAKDPARSAPTFTRYGEAVVREVLGARFIEERPLPPRQEA